MAGQVVQGLVRSIGEELSSLAPLDAQTHLITRGEDIACPR